MERSRKLDHVGLAVIHAAKKRRQRSSVKNKASARKKGSKLKPAMRKKTNAKRHKHPRQPQAPLPLDHEGPLQKAYAAGYKEGMYHGGEAIVERLIPSGRILPGITAEALIQSGLMQHQAEMLEITDSKQVADEIRSALDERRSFSLVRLGDGELLTLAYGTVISSTEAHELGAFLPYAGVPLPDASVQSLLLDSIMKADYVGVPMSRRPEFQMLLFAVSRHYGWSLTQNRLTSSLINYQLHHHGLLLPILAEQRVLLIGNRAAETADLMRKQGVNVTGSVSPVRGFEDIERVLEECRRYEFDICLIAAGVPAVVLCQRIASEDKKVAIDIGHLADQMIQESQQ
ncbi:GT-D fold domain-containing glycosyltransferase [Paenibacillus urinalis]|uniref:GT-D fold domain-containing glycosyltransferase n=1 Tax=Paenibacillus urinalis TaxID=521520 RepID=A0ABY7X7U4_9BACL|nr:MULTISPECIES: GT-D fold domain-containing glycosyltransferase [Paenibacillus]WDH97939.1 GT-D fold domain-containing glycosyltransferase [Paenibacillus urinalis]WDI01618.1 GT-D fold domain-containing glycosyltransferase [Paenibacillus urinalis]